MSILACIELTPNKARWILLDSSLYKNEMRGCDSLARIEEESLEAFFIRVRARLPTHINAIAITADMRAASVRMVTFPFSDVRKVESAMEFEIEGQIPYDIEDVVHTWSVADKTISSTQIIAAITPKEHLEKRLALLEDADLEARAITVPGSGLAELSDLKEEQPTAVIAIGGSHTHITIAKAGKLLFTRSVRIGGEAIDRALGKRFDIALPEARRAKETELGTEAAGGADMTEEQRAISDTVHEGLRPLFAALHTTFRTLSADTMPTKIWLTGGGSKLPGLCSVFEKELGLATEQLDLLHCAVPINPHEVPLTPEYAVVTGLALGYIKRGQEMSLNFRRGIYAFSGDAHLYRQEILRVGVGLSVLLLLAMMGSVLHYWNITAEEARIDQSFCDTTKGIVGRPICDPRTALALMKQSPQVSGGVDIPNFSAVDLFEMISKAVPPEVDIAFKELDFRVNSGDHSRITGKGEAATFEGTEEISRLLKKDNCVSEVDISKQRKTKKTGRVEFSFLVKIKCPEGEKPGAGFAALVPPAMHPASAQAAIQTAEQATEQATGEAVKKKPSATASPPSSSPSQPLLPNRLLKKPESRVISRIRGTEKGSVSKAPHGIIQQMQSRNQAALKRAKVMEARKAGKR